MTDKIKVLWVSNAFGCGGAERQMLYMYEIMKQCDGIEVSILYYAKVDDELDIDAVNACFIDKNKVGKIKTVLGINRYIRENGIHIMHAFGGCSANVYGRFGAVLTKAIPIGAVLGKTHFQMKSLKIANSVLNVFGNWWTVNNNDLIPVLTNDLAFVNPNKIRLLHNGFLPAEKIDYKADQMTEYDDDKGKNIVFTAMGRLHPVKNYPLFLAAAKQIIATNTNVRFWIVGNGEEYENLVELSKAHGIEDHVRFWGYRTDTDIILARTDVFVHTSFTEGSPNAIAEAMRAGKPIISTNSTDLSEMIENDKNGYIVENDQCDELVGAMQKLLSKPAQERTAMGTHSRTLFEKTFLDKRVAEEFCSFYTEVMTKEGRLTNAFDERKRHE